MQLCYVIEDEDTVIKSGFTNFDDEWALAWLYNMVSMNPKTNFFFVVDSTDIF